MSRFFRPRTFNPSAGQGIDTDNILRTGGPRCKKCDSFSHPDRAKNVEICYNNLTA